MSREQPPLEETSPTPIDELSDEALSFLDDTLEERIRVAKADPFMRRVLQETGRATQPFRSRNLQASGEEKSS